MRTLSGRADVTLDRARLLELAALFGHQEVSAFLRTGEPRQALRRPGDHQPGLPRPVGGGAGSSAGHGIERVFSKEQISRILDFIDNNGNVVNENTTEQIARKLGTAAFRCFNTERNSKPRLMFDSFLFRKILDAWYYDMGSISEREGAMTKFIAICRDDRNGLKALAVDLEELF